MIKERRNLVNENSSLFLYGNYLDDRKEEKYNNTVIDNGVINGERTYYYGS